MCYPTSNALPHPSRRARRAAFRRTDALAMARAAAAGAIVLAAAAALPGFHAGWAGPGPAAGILLSVLHAIAYWWVTRRALEVRGRTTPWAWSVLATAGLLLIRPDWIPAAAGLLGASLLAALACDGLTPARSPVEFTDITQDIADF